MTTDQIRAEFERYLLEKFPEYSLERIDKMPFEGIYKNPNLNYEWRGYLAGFNARQAEYKEALEALDDLRQTIYLRPFQDEIENKIKAVKKALGGI